MPRIRTIKPEFPQSESIGRLSREARLLFILLWTVADDHGRTRAAPRYLVGQLYPYDNDAVGLIEDWLSELETVGKIRRYEVEGSQYLDIPSWCEHQRVDNAGKSRIPPCPAESLREPPRTAATVREPPLDLGPRTEDLGPRTKDHTAPGLAPEDEAAFETWWDQFPRYRRGSKGPARKKFFSIIKRGKATAEELLAGLARYNEAGYSDSQYACGAERWLNDERWTIERFPPPGDKTGPPERASPAAKMAAAFDDLGRRLGGAN